MERLLIVGAGGFARSVAEAALASGAFTVVGFLDDRWPDVEPVWGYPVLGKTGQLSEFAVLADAAVVAIGDNPSRRRLCGAVVTSGLKLATVIHPHALVSQSAEVGRGVTVMAGALVGCEAHLGEGALVNAGGIVDHHARIRAYAHLGTGARLAGGAVLGEGGRLQAGATLQPGEQVGPCPSSSPSSTSPC